MKTIKLSIIIFIFLIINSIGTIIITGCTTGERDNPYDPVNITEVPWDNDTEVSGSAPKITSHPVSKTVTEGESVSISVSATGSGNLYYSWYKNDSPIGGEILSSYSISNTTSSDAGSYRCVVSNSYGTVSSNAAVLTVVQGISPPVVNRQPSDISVEKGNKATFSVTASGTDPLQYQWQRNGVNISEANSSSYTTPSTDMSNNGDLFRCIVENSAGKDTSLAAKLIVTTSQEDMPNITYHPINRSVTEGESVTFTVSATGLDLRYQWFKNGYYINGATSPSFSISSVALSNAGSYNCVVSNSYGSVSSNAAELTVVQNISPPVITRHPRDITVEDGDEATFSVTASGSEPLKYQWQRNGKIISGANSSSYTKPLVDMSNDGDLFRCIVENSAGKDTSDEAELTVTFAGLYESRILSCTISDIFFMFRLDLDGSEGSALGGACLSLTNCTNAAEYELELRSNSSGYWYQTTDGSGIKFKLKQNSSGEWIFNQICIGTNCSSITDHGGL
ncbi:MAG: hypothetical protein GX640_10230 [Fibrobacter sp.]|nr:hypothetical protein [Fibrobacter sp.]